MINIVAKIMTFTSWYSLCGVIASQARALSYLGHEAVIWTDAKADLRGWPRDVVVKRAPIEDHQFFTNLDGSVILHDSCLIHGYRALGLAASSGLQREHFVWFHSGVTEVIPNTWNEHTVMVTLNPVWAEPIRRFTGQRVEVVPNPIDPVSNTSTKLSHNALRWAFLRNEEPLMMTLAFQGRRWRAKGLENLLDIIESLRRMSLDPVCFLCVADPQPCMINKLLETQLLGNSVFLISEGKEGVPRKVVQDLLRHSDIHVNTSLAEASSLLVIEAAAAGNLVFYSEDCSGLRSDRPRFSIPIPRDSKKAAEIIREASMNDRSVAQRLAQRRQRGLRAYGRRLAGLLGLENGRSRHFTLKEYPAYPTGVESPTEA